MAVFRALEKPFNFAQEEEKVLQIWEKQNTFKRSISQRKDQGAQAYSFYDGPPFATGMPHYGHIVASSIKDTVARYWTMRGNYVERRFGWDTHGLPIEMETEKSLGLLGPQAIRDFGIDKFNEACRAGVFKYTKEWQRVITRMGRWVDFEHDYKTLDKSFMESVWWVFKQLWEKDLVFQGFRVMPYSVRLSTPLSNFEANLDYKQVQDPSVVVKIKLRDHENTYLLVWTTTPWTLVSNLAVAVGENINYVCVNFENNNYILAQDRLEIIFKNKDYEILKNYSGKNLIGENYEKIYAQTNYEKILGEKLDNCFKIISSSHVTTQDGTGLVHMAPAFGQEDFDACKKFNMPLFDPLNEEGIFTNLVPDLVGVKFKDADKIILKNLTQAGKIFDRSTIEHSYPFCWRSHTPLMYKAVPVWFIDVPKIKKRMIEHNKKIHWVPEAVGHKRFANWLENAADWSISRNRFWGTPIPIWACDACDKKICIGSVEDLEKYTNTKITDLHSHFIDKLEFSCTDCSGVMKRISEVFDCWFESGSMPVAQVHYPFENQDYFQASFPANFIAEGLDQTRGWFYTLLVISTALFDAPPFKNVVVNGMVLAADGAKMSKSKKNFPDPELVIKNLGADAIRAYLVGSPVVRGEPLLFKEEGVREIIRGVMIPIYNSWSFLVQYGILDNFDPKSDLAKAPQFSQRSETDRWILSKLQSLIVGVNKEMSGYYLYKIINPVLSFIDDVTNWYIRRSRRRFWKNAQSEVEKQDKLAAYATLYEVLTSFSKILAPILPFLSESMYQNLVVETKVMKLGQDSVHLCDFPQVDNKKINKNLERDVEITRQVVTMGRALREKYKLKTRQPLKNIILVSHEAWARDAILSHQELILSELNIKNLIIRSEDSQLCTLSARPNFKTLGPRLGADMKKVSQEILKFSRNQIAKLEAGEKIKIFDHEISLLDLTIIREALDDVVVINQDSVTVALDTELTLELRNEGLMREVLSLLQRLRKSREYEISDRVNLELFTKSQQLRGVLEKYQDYIAAELLAEKIIINSDNNIFNKNKEKVENLKIEEHELDIIICLAE